MNNFWYKWSTTALAERSIAFGSSEIYSNFTLQSHTTDSKREMSHFCVSADYIQLIFVDLESSFSRQQHEILQVSSAYEQDPFMTGHIPHFFTYTWIHEDWRSAFTQRRFGYWHTTGTATKYNVLHAVISPTPFSHLAFLLSWKIPGVEWMSRKKKDRKKKNGYN